MEKDKLFEKYDIKVNEKILNDLSKIGISEEKLFPDLPHQISHVVDSVRHNIVFDFLK